MTEPANIPSTSNDTEPGKRTLLAIFGAFAALTVIVVCVSLGARLLPTKRPKDAHRSTPAPALSVAPREEQVDPRIATFLGPLAIERRFESWRITRIDPLQFGRMTFEIEGTTGGSFMIDVHARNPNAPPPIAETSNLALYLRTNQRGGQTPEAFVRACDAFARALRAREDAGHAPPSLESLTPR